MNAPRHHRLALRGRRAFTVVEVMVASAVLVIILGLILNIISQTSTVTRRATDKISAFQGARAAFDLMTGLLGQATLNSYWDYDDPTRPTRYLRKSELHFLIGKAGVSPFPGTTGTGQAIVFQAPSGVTEDQPAYGGMEALLNAVGFYIEYGNDSGLPSPFPTATPRYRYRLMQAIQPTEDLAVYNSSTGDSWVSDLENFAAPIADNIVFMVAWPRKAPADDVVGSKLSDNYSYDSRLDATSATQPETANQLPPLVQVTVVALDEASAARVCTGSTPPSQVSRLTSGLFSSSTYSDFSDDLETLVRNLDDSGLTYKIFTTTLPIRESKMQ